MPFCHTQISLHRIYIGMEECCRGSLSGCWELACSGKSLVHLARRPEACMKHSQPVSHVDCVFSGITSDKVRDELEPRV